MAASHMQEEPAEEGPEYLRRVVEIFPDIGREYVRALHQDLADLDEEAAIETLIQQIIDNGAYPKEIERKKDLKRKREEPENIVNYDTNVRGVFSDYGISAALLKDEFSSIPADHIQATLRKEVNLYPAHVILAKQQAKFENDSPDKPYIKLRQRRKRSHVEHYGTPRYSAAGPPAVLSAPWRRGKLPELVKELKAARHDAFTLYTLPARKEEATRRHEWFQKAAKLIFECKCCFQELPLSRSTSCGNVEEHLFCLECVKRYINTEIGQARHTLRCMDDSGCQASFPRAEIERFVDATTLAALDSLRQREEIRLAGLENYVQCPVCDFGAVCAPIEFDREFRCQNEDCMRISCRLCWKDTHIPLSCDAAAANDNDARRHTVEEAMTEALLRTCNICRSKFYKESGCNKMKCPRCGSRQCYLCSATINPEDNYGHFKNEGGTVPNRSDKRCVLFDNTEARHDAEVDAAAQAASAKIRAAHPELSDEDLRVRVSEAVRQDEMQRIQSAAEGIVPELPHDYNPFDDVESDDEQDGGGEVVDVSDAD
ncbi:MAG: hypothetical protein M1817_005392 [Caeruleum heppii]|nr:MAG: hypothetical protein M1817_005392 [Caeruleum heppii]